MKQFLSFFRNYFVIFFITFVLGSAFILSGTTCFSFKANSLDNITSVHFSFSKNNLTHLTEVLSVVDDFDAYFSMNTLVNYTLESKIGEINYPSIEKEGTYYRLTEAYYQDCKGNYLSEEEYSQSKPDGFERVNSLGILMYYNIFFKKRHNQSEDNIIYLNTYLMRKIGLQNGEISNVFVNEKCFSFIVKENPADVDCLFILPIYIAEDQFEKENDFNINIDLFDFSEYDSFCKKIQTYSDIIVKNSDYEELIRVSNITEICLGFITSVSFLLLCLSIIKILAIINDLNEKHIALYRIVGYSRKRILLRQFFQEWSFYIVGVISSSLLFLVEKNYVESTIKKFFSFSFTFDHFWSLIIFLFLVGILLIFLSNYFSLIKLEKRKLKFIFRGNE